MAFIRSLIWPGYTLTHSPSPITTSGFYHGDGLKNNNIGYQLYFKFKMKVKTPVTDRGGHQKDTQSLISQYHTISKQLRSEKDEDKKDYLNAKLISMGGLHSYQAASLRGGRIDQGFSAAGKWLVKELKGLDSFTDNRRLKVLDVGAINGEVYQRFSRIMDVTSIDLISQSPLVTQQDFFDRPIPTADESRFDVICLSLVINFVTDPSARGRMLALTTLHLPLGGLCYIVLPLPCLKNSRYLNEEVFSKLCQSIGYSLLKKHSSPKLCFFLLRLDQRITTFPTLKKIEVRPGGQRNNFSITLS